MTTTVTTPGTDFVGMLRAHSRRYHDAHPFHVRMNAGELSPGQLRGWIANRFYYQENIPRKDGAILSNCPDVEVRRRWPARCGIQHSSRNVAISFVSRCGRRRSS